MTDETKPPTAAAAGPTTLPFRLRLRLMFHALYNWWHAQPSVLDYHVAWNLRRMRIRPPKKRQS